MIEIASLFVCKRLAVCDEELHVARVRLVNMRVINFVDNAVRNGEPKPATRVVSGADTFLRATCPTRFKTRRAKGSLGVTGK
jgi:hypothetical protein